MFLEQINMICDYKSATDKVMCKTLNAIIDDESRQRIVGNEAHN